MERYTVNRRSKRTKTYGGLLTRWKLKYVTGFLNKNKWVTTGYDLNNASYVVNRRYSRGKMSPVCHNFVQNAWKKDFCSNCFKSREEHQKDRSTDGSKYLATPFQNRGAFFKKSPNSILKVAPKKKGKRNVRFPEEVSSVIGFGGDDWSDGEEFEMSEENDDDDTFPDTEEERELHRITKSNTDFNTVKANLLGETVTKSYTSLMLGKTQTDSAGKKKTLLVSVTPFGQENNGPTIKSHIRKPAVTNLVSSTTEESSISNYKTNIIVQTCVKENETILNSNKIEEPIPKGICSEKSLLEEITETLEQNRITAMSMTKCENTKPTVVEEVSKEKIEVQDEVDKRETNETKKNSLTRHSPITRNQERPKVNLTSRSEFKFCKINIESYNMESAVNTLTSTTNTSFASDDESFSGRLDSDNDDSGHFSETTKCDETVKIKVFNENDQKNLKLSPMTQLRKADGQTGYSTFQTPIIDLPAIIPKPHVPIFTANADREDPDGRADPDEPTEAPALPTSPVPAMDPRPSFLHGMITDMGPLSKPAVPEKPKLPIKPLTKPLTIKKIATTTHQQSSSLVQTKKEEVVTNTNLTEEKNNEITEVREDKPEPIYFAKPVLTKQDSDTSLNNMTKRKAPTPPTTPSSDEYANSLYQRNPNTFMNSVSPVVREKEKRERSVPKKSDDNPEQKRSEPPEPAPRRNISLSHDNLLIEDKRKGKLKFSIKKLLRIGSSKDLDKKELTMPPVITKMSCKMDEIYDLTPKPKPRLVIIHPLDINGSNVEVLKSNEIADSMRRLSHDDSSSIYSGSSGATDPEIPKVVSKPPPPPRHTPEESKPPASPAKPARPPPPKSIALQKKQKQQTWSTAPNKSDTIYANLGEIRSALAPRKPERTASMREREAQLELPKRRTPITDDADDLDNPHDIVQATNEPVINNYDDVYNSTKYDNESIEENLCDSAKSSDSDYEYVNHARSSSPECDSGIKSDENSSETVMRKSGPSPDYPKYSNGIFNRSSLPYCGSETESEIYSPYSFYSSTDAMDSPCNEDYPNDVSSKTTNKLRVRKGRSVVHKSLEDNYGAVVIANHEALAQVLEQVQQSATMPPSLRGLKASTNLRFSDFALQHKANCVKAGQRYFYPATWQYQSGGGGGGTGGSGGTPVTLMLSTRPLASQLQHLAPAALSPGALTEFCDLVPTACVGEDGDMVQATIVVLASAQVDTIQTYGESLNLEPKDQQLQPDHVHEAIFMMLQLINGLKYLQARGVEETTENLASFIILRENSNLHGSTMNLQDDRMNSLSAPKTNSYGRLCVLQGLSDEINNKSEDSQLSSLCKCAIKALEILLPEQKLSPLLKEMLQEERAVSLNQAKSVLEFTLWGPSDVVQGVPVIERELSLQRWLDLERATVLHGLVRSRVQLNVFEQLHLMFLVRSTAKTMCDASVLLENAKVF